MKLKIYQVDAFTDRAYGGNPAGVVPEAVSLSDGQMQKIALEMNLSETAFVFPGGENHDFEVRFFTPLEEVDLCGHATIATFHLLKELGFIQPGKVRLVQKTRAGLLEVVIQPDGGILMRQAPPRKIRVYGEPHELAAVMGVEPEDLMIPGVLEMPESWSTGLPDILLPISSVSILKAMKPDMAKLSDFSRKEEVTGVHAFAFDAEGTLWCRNFAPACGIPEEAATGTSNGALGACLYHHGWKQGDSLVFTAHQGDWMGRASRIAVTVLGSAIPEIWVGGHAVTVLQGQILIPDVDAGQ